MNLEVLNVDDDKMVLFIHEKMMHLSEFSSTPKSFLDAQETLTYISKHKSDDKKFIIFLDVNMPNLDGWQFIEELKKKELAHYCYVFVMSSSVDSRDKEKTKSYETAIGFIEKPLSVDKLNHLKATKELLPFFS